MGTVLVQADLTLPSPTGRTPRGPQLPRTKPVSPASPTAPSGQRDRAAVDCGSFCELPPESASCFLCLSFLPSSTLLSRAPPEPGTSPHPPQGGPGSTPAVLPGTCLPLQQSRGPLLTRSRPRSSSLSCRCDKDKVPSCWFQSSEPRFRKWALSSGGRRSTPGLSRPTHLSALKVTRPPPHLSPHCST